MWELFLELGVYILDLLSDPIFLLVVFIVGLQYYRLYALQQKLHGNYTIRWGYLCALLAVGVAAGYLGSILLVLTGISIELTGPMYLWGVSLALYLFHQRLLCFAYSGGIVCLCYLFFGFPLISVPQVLGLVAILHLVEASLIFFSGHWDPVPVYYRVPDGEIVGAYVLQKFWPLPLVALANTYITASSGGIALLPHWWPLLIPKQLSGIVLALTSLPAALGYGDLAVSSTPRQRAQRSSLLLAGYSLTLLGLAYFSVTSRPIGLFGALFAALGHESVIRIGKWLDLGANPLFKKGERGVKLLDVLYDSPAYRAGIRRGDIVLSIDGREVFTRGQLSDLVRAGGKTLKCEFMSFRSGEVCTRRVVAWGDQLGVVTVPEDHDQVYVDLNGAGPLLKRVIEFVPKIRF